MSDPPKDSVSQLLWDVETSRLLKLTREVANSPSAKLARQMAESPSAKLARQMAESPSAKLALQMAESPSAKLARQMAASPSAKLARQMAESPSAKLAQHVTFGQRVELVEPTLAKALAPFKPVTIESREAASLAGFGSIGIDQIAKTLSQIKSFEATSGLSNAISEVQKLLSDFGKPYGGLAAAVNAIEEQNRTFQKTLVASLGGPIGNIARRSQWASMLRSIESGAISTLYSARPNAAAEVTLLYESTLKSLAGRISEDQEKISAMLGLSRGVSASLETTLLKMSAVAGLTDVIGTQTRAWDEAYNSLFGEWRTRPDLPESYWRDVKIRRRMYDAAEVDPGLAGANLKVAVEVVIESGLVSGARSETSAVAVIALGDVSMTIRSHGTRSDAYKVLGRFEEELRAYITRKLSEKFGPDWFKVRIDGNIAGEAKRIRRQALERGEKPMPLINYTELGHLASIILGRKNWDEVFGAIFINSAEFDIDMQKLIAVRRPTMHIRQIDGVRLVELICVVQRLSRQMEDDGAWKIASESDR